MLGGAGPAPGGLAPPEGDEVAPAPGPVAWGLLPCEEASRGSASRWSIWFRRGGKPLGRAQTRSRRARVRRDLFIRGAFWLLRQQPQAGRLAARLVPHEPLDQAVLAGVVGQRDETPAGLQLVGSLRKGSFDRLELLVHFEAERLKGAARRVRPYPTRR